MKISKNLISRNSVLASLAVILLLIGVTAGPFVHAQSLQEQIDAINSDTANRQASINQLGAEASSLQEVISKLQAEINHIQGQIAESQKKHDDTVAQIAAAEAELARQKALLGETIKALYLEGEITTLEMLASSRDLSEFVDKEQYRITVKNKIKNTLDTINALKAQLVTQKETLVRIIEDQKVMQAKVVAVQGEHHRILGMNQAQQQTFDQQIRNNNSVVSELRRQQAAENARHGSTVTAGDPSRGGYPSKWANAPQDSLLDDWGMYNRECVSYAAWKVHESGRYMPYWGGRGNANEWPDNTGSKGHEPRVGAVAITYWGPYGHAMYVEAVSGDKVYVSQYNYGVRGEYSEMWLNASEVDWFLYF